MPLPRLVTILSNASSKGFSEPFWLICQKGHDKKLLFLSDEKTTNNMCNHFLRVKCFYSISSGVAHRIQ